MAGLSEPSILAISPGAVIVVLGSVALPTARRIKDILPNAEIHGLDKRMTGMDGTAPTAHGVDQTFAHLATHLQHLYRAGRPIIGLCASGILIRCLAQCIGAAVMDAGDASEADVGIDTAQGAAKIAYGGTRLAKCIEPPLLAVAMDGSAVVPLLGGLAGVNALARVIAAALRVSPAITTTGELRFGTCLLDPPEGYRLADIEVGKRFVSDLLAGETTRIESQVNVPWLDNIDLPKAADATLRIRISVETATDPHTLLIHPRAILMAFAPIGPLATSEALLNADGIVAQVRETLAQRGLAPMSLAALILDAKYIGDDAVQEAAMRLNVPVRFVTTSNLTSNTASNTAEANEHGQFGSLPGSPNAHPEGHPHAARRTATSDARKLLDIACSQAWPNMPLDIPGAPANAEPTSSEVAMSPAGQAQLPQETQQTALTILAAPLQADELLSLGRKRGSLSVVGIGPGDKALLAPAAQQALANADDILGYATYTDMAGPYAAHQIVHPTDNREEMQRARHAFALASSGRAVVMVSSGDPGVFAMASAVIEALEEALDEAQTGAQGHHTARVWSSVRLNIIPGISAAMATAAVAGAPLGHDFCVLSLSDNLKPWEVIASRLQLAAQADLVIALYNPVSKARPWQLARALDILRSERDAECLVILGRDIGRPGASLRTLRLHEVQSDMVDMRTMLIVGSSTTRQFRTSDGTPWVYTPRWYPSKAESNPGNPSNDNNTSAASH